QRRQLRRRHHDLVGIAAMALPDDHAIAHRNALRAIHFDDVAGRFHARRERQFRLELVLAGRHQYVREIDSGRAHGNTHLPRRQRLRRKWFQSQPPRRAEFAADDSSRHQAARSLRRASASRISGRRSLPKYMSVLSTKMVGEPKPPRAITSSVLALSWSLMAWSAIAAKNFCGSMPTLLQMSDSTSSCEMSLSPPQ